MAKDPKSTYYDAGGIEVLDVIQAKLTQGQYTGYLLGNMIKYSLRLNHKGTPERDAEKCAFYSDELKHMLAAPKAELAEAYTRLQEINQG